MRKLVAVILAVLIIASPISAHAVQSRYVTPSRSLTFSGTTAHCNVSVIADSQNSTIIATIQLWQGGTCIATWYANGLGTLNSSNTCAVTSGLQYTLTVSATVDGATISIPSVTKTCP